MLVLLLLLAGQLFAQESKEFSLKDVVSMAQRNSLAGKIVENRFQNKYWRYFSYKRSFLPAFSFSATTPDLNRSISKITLPDGGDAFIERSLASYSLNLRAVQPIAWTGGQIIVNSNLNRLDVFGTNPSVSYLSQPISVGLSQPLFGFNSYKWERKIEPLVYDNAAKQYVEELEGVAIECTNLYYNLLNAQVQYDIAKVNEANNDTIYNISEGRYKLGKIAESDLLQMELSLLNSRMRTAQADLDLKFNKQQLAVYLGMNSDAKFSLKMSDEVPTFEAQIGDAISKALTNNAAQLDLKIDLLEAERDLAQTRSQNRFNTNLFASYGLTQSSTIFDEVYTDPQDQQTMLLGLQVPLFNWGVSSGRIKQAIANAELVSNTVDQQRQQFEQQAFYTAARFNLMRKQVDIARKAEFVAQKRYDVTKQRYLIGKSSITDLNIALSEKDMAIREKIQSLRNYWLSYYELRQLTHYDYERNVQLSEPER